MCRTTPYYAPADPNYKNLQFNRYKEQIRISGITDTVAAKEVKAAPGYVIDTATQVTATVNPEDTQTLTFVRFVP